MLLKKKKFLIILLNYITDLEISSDSNEEILDKIQIKKNPDKEDSSEEECSGKEDSNEEEDSDEKN